MKKVFVFLFIIIFFFLVLIYKSQIALFCNYLHSLKNEVKVNIYVSDLMKKNTDLHSKYNNQYFSWDKEQLYKKWTYFNGFLMRALIEYPKYNDFVEKYYFDNICDDGKINSEGNIWNEFELGSVDDIAPAKTLFYLSESPNWSKYKLNIDYCYKNLQKQPVLSKVGKNFVHKTTNNNWKTYPFSLDTVFMSLPFIAEYKHFYPENKNIDLKKDVFDRMDWIAKHLKNKNGLYYHGIKADGITANNIVWLRAVGWYAIAQVEILEYYPESKEKELLKQQLQIFLDSMLNFQNKKTGMWHNVVDLDEGHVCNYLETSGSAMMAYVLMKSFLEDYTPDKKYALAGLKAYNGIADKYLKINLFKENELSGIYCSSSVYNNPDEYCQCYKYVENEAKGIAPFILANSLVNKTFYKLFLNTKYNVSIK